MQTRTPLDINEKICALCTRITREFEPVYVPVNPLGGGTTNECFYNVRRQVKKNGGVPIYGWSIWEWPKVLVEAEFHCIWKSPNGDLVDISPRPDQQSKILFLQDSSKAFNFHQPTRTDSIRMALNPDPLIDEFIKELERVQSLIPRPNMPYDYSLLNVKRNKLQAQIYKRYVSKNASCLCGSGKKFGKCCFSKIH